MQGGGALVRKFSSIKRWEKKDYLGKEDISADAVTRDLQTTNDSLSFWSLEDPGNEEELREVVLALSSSSKHLESFDLVWFPERAVIREKILIRETKGEIPVEDLRGKHRDVVELGLEKLGVLARLVNRAILEAKTVRRFRASEIKLILKRAIDAGRLSPDSISESLKKKILG